VGSLAEGKVRSIMGMFSGASSLLIPKNSSILQVKVDSQFTAVSLYVLIRHTALSENNMRVQESLERTGMMFSHRQEDKNCLLD